MSYEKLQVNVENVWGDSSCKWLQSLPDTISQLAKLWSLTDITLVDNLSYNYVARAIQHNTQPVVLKISCDEKLIASEYRALQHFSGQGAIKVLANDKTTNALLLEQVLPGLSLKYTNTLSVADTARAYADVAKRLIKPSGDTNAYPHMRDWCCAIDKLSSLHISNDILRYAVQLRDKLLSSTAAEYICHGDLHLDNILQHEQDYIAIDPKGIIGELSFEAAAVDLYTDDELLHDLDMSKTQHRIEQLAAALNINSKRLLSWFFMRSLINAEWFIEDQGDPSQVIKLALHFYRLLKTDD